MENVLDIFGIGCGPFNLSVAILAEKNGLSSLFVDRKSSMNWHKGMMLPFATIQNSHIRDLISLVDPKSSYTFNNFLLENGRLEEHTIAGFQFTKRWEFEQYLQWVTTQLDNVLFGVNVERISRHENGLFIINTNNKGIENTFYAKHLVVGTGVSPIIPNFSKGILHDTYFHNSEYNFRNKNSVKSIVIIGGGQSSLEICLDIMDNYPNIEQISVIYKESFIHQIEASQFAEDAIFSSWGLESYFTLSDDVKNRILPDLRFTSDGASLDTIREFYQRLYQNKYLTHKVDFKMYKHSEVTNVCYEDNYSIFVKDLYTEQETIIESEMVILATGYKQEFANDLFSKDLLKEIKLHENTPEIDKDYCIYKSEAGNSIYIVNGGKHKFGVVDPNLSLSAIRANRIVSSIISKEGK